MKALKNIILLTGYYGCGKTNLAVNLALDYCDAGEMVTLIDLDVVNPFFRSADFLTLLEEKGIELIAPRYANTLIDIPAVPREVSAAFSGRRRVIADVGGDDAGAAVLGRYGGEIERAGGADMAYLFSVYRPRTGSVKEVHDNIRAIEAVSGLKVTYLINSSNLGKETSSGDVSASLGFSNELSELTGIPLLMTVALGRIAGEVEGLYAVKRFVRLPWEPFEDE